MSDDKLIKQSSGTDLLKSLFSPETRKKRWLRKTIISPGDWIVYGENLTIKETSDEERKIDLKDTMVYHDTFGFSVVAG